MLAVRWCPLISTLNGQEPSSFQWKSFVKICGCPVRCPICLTWPNSAVFPTIAHLKLPASLHHDWLPLLTANNCTTASDIGSSCKILSSTTQDGDNNARPVRLLDEHLLVPRVAIPATHQHLLLLKQPAHTAAYRRSEFRRSSPAYGRIHRKV